MLRLKCYIWVVGQDSCPVVRSSCNEIIQNKESRGDGEYTIKPAGLGELRVYCDMTTEGGKVLGNTPVSNSKRITAVLLDSRFYYMLLRKELTKDKRKHEKMLLIQ
ncbi:hypothetical protein AC249_AIPGENE25563 [Exaiptasia diaphana]|nr:hypothetical protein AC249_AIPGENE25563 [Exaiptasia diaphana]